MNDDRDALRRQLRARRRALHPARRAAAAAAQLRLLARSPLLRPGARVALYVAAGSEAPSAALLRLALARGCRVTLPRATCACGCRLQLLPWRGGPLGRDAFGLAAPRGGRALPARCHDLVIVPLLGFDARGTRLGSGAGCYDRLLAFRRGRAGRPLLLGLAFEAQRCAQPLPRAAHDVPLDAVLTERGLFPTHA